VELTWRRELNQASLDQSSYQTRARRSVQRIVRRQSRPLSSRANFLRLNEHGSYHSLSSTKRA
jgi:hypothetical protein